MIELNLVDSSFAHIEYSVPGVKSELMKWNRGSSLDQQTVYTHEHIFSDDVSINDLGLLFESQAIIPNVYSEAITHPDRLSRFKYVFTHSSQLLKTFTHTMWIPGGGIWVGGTYGGGEIKIYPKSKLCSIVSSNKNMCHLHNMRSAIAKYCISNTTKVRVFGTLTDKWVPIIDTLQDYMFSIVVENYVDDLYFTEKLLNCFATGTIPVYIGARNIGSVFNKDGIIEVSNPKDLLCIIDGLSPGLYDSKKEAVQDNFERCQKFRLIEDYIVENYL